MLQPMSIILAKLITAMTKEGKFKDAIQDKIGATVDTTDLKKQLSVLNASLHQAETIKTRLEQQIIWMLRTLITIKKYQIYRDDWMLNMIE
jgi:site-specific DNA recombinase